MKKLLPITLLLALGACATPEQLAQQKQFEAEQDIATCRGYGLRPGTDAFGNCRLQLDIARQQAYNTYYYAPPPRPYFDSSIYYFRR